MDKFKVTFFPDNKTVEVARDTTILAAAIKAGVYINSVCGGDGVCGKCKVVVKKGKVLSQSAGHLTPEEKKRGVHFACATEVQSDLEVEVPAESKLSLEGLSQEEIAKRLEKDYSAPEDIELVKPQAAAEIFAHSPLTTKLYLELPQPTLDDKVSDLERLQREISRKVDIPVTQIALSNIKGLGELLRASEWKVTVTLGKKGDTAEIILVEPGNTAQNNFGVCFDIGTTTVSTQLIDLNSQQVLGTKATYNKQAAFGSDVITRIIYAKDADGLQELHDAVVDDMNEMIQELIKEHSIDLNDLTCAVCAGNTTMIHLLLRVDPTYIRREPYVPTLNFVPVMRAAEAELRINPRGLLYCLPGVASYVGGDVTAGVLSCGLYKQEELGILIDIGTNGEVVLGNKDFLISAAASAGPAFEGSGVSCGMRASKGAIQKVKISAKDFNVAYEVIGKVTPRGICGSGYIDIIAQMLRAGILDKDGKIKALKNKRVREGKEGKEFVLVFKGDSGSSQDIVITEPDIDNLKRAKAAIYAAISILAKHMGFDFSQVKRIFIAGGFGTYLDMANAISIGLLPDLDKSRFVFVGNSSLAGACDVILSYEAKKKADEIARKITYFELSVEPGYMDEYMAALFFPHTDLNRFPSVKV
jgi:uncharacterized 2Fe-2S/4Fe-4S cluster protein (DUF4445 family)